MWSTYLPIPEKPLQPLVASGHAVPPSSPAGRQEKEKLKHEMLDLTDDGMMSGVSFYELVG